MIGFTQNFLHNQALVHKLIQQAQLPKGSTVLEIGPGKGIITAGLAEQVGSQGRVIAVELDPKLVSALQTRFQATPQVSILSQDILTYPLEQLPKDYRVFSNVPFNITSTLLEYLFTPPSQPIQAHLILQVDGLIAEGGGETFKSLLLAPLYQIRLGHHFARTDFTPQPRVDTALFTFDPHVTPRIDPAQYALYKDFLALIAKDRVGEGVWKKLFSAGQLDQLRAQTGLIGGRGLKTQSAQAVIAAFEQFTRFGKVALVRGAMQRLREEQDRREQINTAGGHHRSKSGRNDDRRR
ncbi:MAG: rRNA adenine N(6)-methyltransferase family protein [Anaerolineae bacterium]|nr:rRNA adenine N(6)-methyltransferase family protein [Anaerolineae bacterium]